MKMRFASLHLPHLPARLHGPLRFGSRWRGHELALRVCQVAVFAVLAVLGGQVVAQIIRAIVRAFSA